MWIIIPVTFGKSCRPWAGVAKSLNAEPPSMTTQPLHTGNGMSGPRFAEKPTALGLASFLSMKAAFCSSPTPSGLGPPGGKHNKISAINALVVSPRRKRIALYLQFRKRSFKGPDVKRFLQYLLKQVDGPIILLWDRGRIHRDHRVKAWCETHPRLQVEEFPGYAPELNPAEYVWCQADSALANSAPEDLDELKPMLVATKRRLLHSQDLLWSCIYASDLPWK